MHLVIKPLKIFSNKFLMDFTQGALGDTASGEMPGANQLSESEALVLLVGTLAMTFMVLVLLIFVFLYQRKIRRKQRQLAETRARLQAKELEAAYSFIEGQNNEKQRVSRELHDNVGSLLAVVKLKVNAQVPQDKKATNQLNEVLDEVLKQVRNLSHDLGRGIFKKRRLDKAIREYVETITGSTDLVVIYNSFGLERNHSDRLGQHMFRIVQELLHNTLKYARAKHINLEINYLDSSSMNMVYKDDGVGFDPGMRKPGIGLKNIQDRVENLNGKFYLTSSLGKGTEVLIDIPLNETEL